MKDGKKPPIACRQSIGLIVGGASFLATQPITRAVKASFQIEGRRVQSGRVLEMADDPMVEVTYLNSAEVMRVVEKPISDLAGWEFPAASVSAVELKLT